VKLINLTNYLKKFVDKLRPLDQTKSLLYRLFVSWKELNCKWTSPSNF